MLTTKNTQKLLLSAATYVQNAEKLFQKGYNLITNSDKCRKTVDISAFFGYY